MNGSQHALTFSLQSKKLTLNGDADVARGGSKVKDKKYTDEEKVIQSHICSEERPDGL